MNKMKNIKHHAVGTVPKSNRKTDTTNTHIHDLSLSWLGTDTTIKSGRVKLLLYTFYSNV